MVKKYLPWLLLLLAMPTLAKHWGGNVDQFAKWSSQVGMWEGNYRKYPIRWQPQIDFQEDFIQASIIHPVKNFDHPARVFHRDKRNRYATANT